MKNKKTLDDLVKKLRYCEKHGHKEPINLPYTVTSHSDPLRDKGAAKCNYCGLVYERPLTNEEIGRINKFFNKTIYTRITI